jgi:hypothetical protein
MKLSYAFPRIRIESAVFTNTRPDELVIAETDLDILHDQGTIGKDRSDDKKSQEPLRGIIPTPQTIEQCPFIPGTAGRFSILTGTWERVPATAGTAVSSLSSLVHNVIHRDVFCKQLLLPRGARMHNGRTSKTRPCCVQ